MQGAARHGWFNADKSQTEIWLVKFGKAGDAAAMLRGLGNRTLGAAKTKTTLAAVGGFEVVNTVPNNVGDSAVAVYFAVGDTFVRVEQFNPSPNAAMAEQLAEAQYAKLKGN